MKLVIVESPTKAKTIGKYLGDDYKVIASYGHVRNLVPKDGSVDPDNNFEMKWHLEPRASKHISEINKFLSKADSLVLATDPDREGEAISWHLCEILKDSIKNIPVSRITFHEITKSAITKSLNDAKNLNTSLVEAYLARCALDYLVGFKLSPVLWRKLPGSRSAGRVQSVALRLVFEREREIEKFVEREYWTISAIFKNKDSKQFSANLIKYNGKKLDKFDIETKKDSEEILSNIKGLNYHISNVEQKDVNKYPTPPFITSTLQQEGVRKLGFSAKKIMQIAQKLYEGVDIDGQPTGLITYMRTDSTIISEDAISSMRSFIKEQYGSDYVPNVPNIYSTKVKNTQEAHEAIRPTNINITPDKVESILDKDMFKLYSLIWERSLASQMHKAILNKITIEISDESLANMFRSTGSSIKFDGFLKLYEESLDEKLESDSEQLLPEVSISDDVKVKSFTPQQHFTLPPPRYTEASIVKKMEELGIGRPSTYANIIFVLQDRKYISIKKKRFFLEDLGRLVSIFLLKYFPVYVEYTFTADLEQELDDVSNDKKDRVSVLSNFWNGFAAAIDEAYKLKISDVISTIEFEIEDFLFPNTNGKINKSCPQCSGTLGLKLGKFGAFVACSNYPECKFNKKIIANKEDSFGDEKMESAFDPKVIGRSDEYETDILLKKGPYGFYLEANIDGKVKRSSVPKNIASEDVDINLAEFLISLPKVLGQHPDDGTDISISIGKFGPYIKHNNKFVSVKDFDEFRNLTLDLAINKLLNKKDK